MSVPTGPVYYPFAVVPPTSASNVFPNDILIETVYPGLIFDAQEAGGTYAVIREVNGCLWFVVNADFNETTLEWTQEDPTNPNTPAYAMEICAAGTWNWYSGLPTLIPGTPVVWRQVVLVDVNGSIISTPQTVTASGDPSQQVNVTWNLGGAAQAIARQVNVTDSSSAASSLLDNLEVGGVPKWSVDKTGTLTVGIIPSARITGLTPFPGFNNVTLTGTTTMTGPVVMNSTLDVFGAGTFHSSLTADSTFFAVGLATLNGHADINSGLTVTGGEGVTGGLTTDTLHVTSTSNLDGTVTAGAGLSVAGTSDLHNVVLSPGDSITVNGTTPVVTLESTDGSIGAVQVSPTEYNLSVLTAPIAPGSAYVNTAFYGFGSTSGTISLGPLPGTSLNTYRVICWGSLQFHDASHTLTLTGVVATGVTWDVASQGYENSQSGSFPFMYFGNAEGGTTPTINWSSDDPVDFTPLFMTIMASIQL